MQLVALLLLLYVAGKIIYRLYFHPLRKFPGPKLAAISSLPEFYYNVVKGGMFIWEVERMHDKYGPIVRVNPDELHISDPDYCTEILAYCTEKIPFPNAKVAMANSTIATADYNVHAARRRPLSPFFSKKAIQRLHPMISAKIEKLCQRMQTAARDGTVLHMKKAFSALTVDIISEYTYGFSLNCLDQPDLRNEVHDAVASLTNLTHILKFIPFVSVLASVPESLLSKISPAVGTIIALKQSIRRKSQEVLANPSEIRQDTHALFHALDKGPLSIGDEDEQERLVEEGIVILGAGMDTTSSTLNLILFHLLYQPRLMVTLREELDLHAEATTWPELEQLPYLKSVVSEGLRLYVTFSERMQRRNPDEDMKYQDWIIPAGTQISQSLHFIHTNAEIFPNPDRFDPGRWIRAQERGERLENRLVAFSRGSRQCLGLHLAYAELYLTIATIVRRFDLELFETRREDIVHYREYTLGRPKKPSAGLRVKVNGLR
ncbi:hypothetical protein CP533_2745 [Ophiocordyceps camponoti-saundersi (nom. inval.)]|nr:hypothetical protein CP533_2745 [Ophiocordyceps camponoti-saundersi (nom. inval.)]